MTSKLVLVTGASSGIGEATAKRYGAAGAHVLLLARNAERLFGVAHAIREAGGTATAHPIDLSASEAIKDMAARVEAENGTPDILINNAGAGRWLPLVDTSPEDARAMMDVPYLAAFNVTRAFAPAMIARGTGNIAFITSPASYLAWPNASAYIAARRALAGLAETLQSELKPAACSSPWSCSARSRRPIGSIIPAAGRTCPRPIPGWCRPSSRRRPPRRFSTAWPRTRPSWSSPPSTARCS
ncbi:SDR family NAD(P)-dependent oxidoreductase [Methyloceanibacter superfactus]|uniref:SDR family NAD(P)-dependent oxidoreductase n=1 Tax=Methyloceanibacter superfactus TaxID=1774969 RepID=UPI0013010F83|nr:SDR family oxidoreductase [Methyloceanibacter superfactus]